MDARLTTLQFCCGNVNFSFVDYPVAAYLDSLFFPVSQKVDA
jgi:hypothetical protein